MSDVDDAIEAAAESGDDAISGPSYAARATSSGVFSTNDPEEIDCPTCEGIGFIGPKRSPAPPRPVYDLPDLPF